MASIKGLTFRRLKGVGRFVVVEPREYDVKVVFISAVYSAICRKHIFILPGSENVYGTNYFKHINCQ
jgi:hypothetical protein